MHSSDIGNSLNLQAFSTSPDSKSKSQCRVGQSCSRITNRGIQVALREGADFSYDVLILIVKEPMTKPTAKSTAKIDAPKIVNICRNRRATHEYEILDKIECGIVLVGTEVKSLREAHANLEDAYAKIENGEVFLVGCEIQEYTFGNRLNHKPKRDRKLLLHKKEIERFAGKASERGHTLIPLQMYFKNGVAKLELAVARGKQLHDKRESLKKAEAKREIARVMSSKRKSG
jgi:SsrA-binding protein